MNINTKLTSALLSIGVAAVCAMGALTASRSAEARDHYGERHYHRDHRDHRDHHRGSVTVYIPAPPVLRYEYRPSHRHAHVWVPGFWDWNGRHHHWIAGHYVRERAGYHYYPHRWEQRNGHWVREGGRWGRRDNDRDGVPNRYDHVPNNPYRR